MRLHPRVPLPSKVMRGLAVYQLALDDAITANTAASLTAGDIAEAHWKKRRDNTVLETAVRALQAMASSGMARCFFCEHDRGHQIDHREPKSVAPHATFTWTNMGWACGLCNGTKTTRYDPDMLDPTTHDPLDHLVLTTSGAWHARGGSKHGAATCAVLPINRQELSTMRAFVVRELRERVEELGTLSDRRRAEKEEKLRELVIEQPLSDVFAAMLRQAGDPGGRTVLGDAFVDVVEATPAMHRWLTDADAARAAAVAPVLDDMAKTVRIRR